MFSRCLRADFYKMKRSSVTIAHIVIPIVVSAVFLAYYAASGWNETDKISAFYEALGFGFPVLVGIFVASTMEQEQNAGSFQNLLTIRSKKAALFSKVVTLLLLSLFALLFTAVLFGLGFIMIHGQGTASMGVFLMAAFVMWLSAIPLYLIFEIFAFVFGKAFVIGAGLISGLISALFLIVLDYGTKDERVFLCGASSKDAGGRITSIVEDYGIDKYKPMIKKLLQNGLLQLP